MFRCRIDKVRSHLKKQNLDAVLISAVSNICYLTGYANFSQNEREAYLIITKNEQFIITDGRYSGVIKRQVPYFKLLELTGENSLKNIFAKFARLKVLGIEEDEITVSEHKMLKKHFKKMKHLDIKSHRSVKTDDEIRKIEEAAKLGDKAFKYILGKIKEGISEKELAYELELFIKKNGGELSFPPIIAFGRNSAIPHHQTGETKLDKKEGQFILLDFGVKLENYCSDMTRTIIFGKPTNKQKRIYETVLKAQQKAIDFINSKIKSGKKVKASDADKTARDFIISQKYPNIPHSLGHGIGLQVHEHPSLSSKSRDILKTGMVFSIEPGIYLPDFGGVRTEDLFCISKIVPSETKGLFVLGKNDLKQLTNSPKSIISIQALS
ncbi:MAG: Xaa-Pro peptidase family protein [Candidatus Daviesbacteria bacterium]|nr:Xaa-Pro peptidase family protein [Candidatus Daviesbacteria bacterium]